MDDAVTEGLSRLIDGDLDPVELEELTEKVESEPAVRRELESLRRVRSSLQSLAARERPPAALDALVDPLLRGRPERQLVPPWVRWLATAAVVVLGVTVVLEVQRRQPESTGHTRQDRALDRVQAEPTERFTLAPLPTSSAPEKRAVGAADRLLAAPEPEIDADIEPPPALEVLGPLDPEEMAGRKPSPRRDRSIETVDVREARDPSLPESGETSVHDSSPEGARRSAVAPSADRSATVQPATPPAKSTQPKRWSGAAIPTAEAQLFVFMGDEAAWKAFDVAAPVEAGRYALRIKIEDGRVLEVWPVANPPATTRQVRASQLVIGLEVDNVPDGEYAAEVVVEFREPPGR